MNAFCDRKETVLKSLGTNAETGLSEKLAADRLSIFGANKLNEKKRPSIALRFLAQFNDFMVLILLLAAAVSVVISSLRGEKDFIDAIIILAIVTLNAILGLVQENKAERALDALKRLSAPMARVLREGKLLSLDASLLVPGDIILLKAGDFVPADARLITCHSLRAEESSLTGESTSVDKDSEAEVPEGASLGDRHNMVYSGTLISGGRGKAVVTRTGMNTEVGRIAELIMSEETPDTPLHKKLEHTGKILGIGALAICAVVFIVGVMRSVPPFEMFMTSVSLAVAAIPEGLPAVVTIVLAMGVQRMTKHNAIVRKLPAVETLGQATVICSDKTGTLTMNKMKVTEVSDGFSLLRKDDPAKNNILKLGLICGDSRPDEKGTFGGDPTEAAIASAASLAGLSCHGLDAEYPRTGEIPFDSARKLMTVIVSTGSGSTVITKGAPDVLLRLCTRYLRGGRELPLGDTEKRLILASNTKMASSALRVIAVAAKSGPDSGSAVSGETERGLCFAGLIGIIDPPREEAYEAVKICGNAGIRPVMITGDHVLTANAIARQLGIMKPGDRAMTGDELDETPQSELCEKIYKYSVFARVSPEHKMRIVRAFQSHGDIVAMTGDGVNDAPALKSADIGCSMGISGTDVAKGAADMILTDDNFATIVEAVKEGRRIFSNIRKSTHFLLSSNIGEIITIFAALLMGWSTPLLAIHLLWVNLVTDSLPAIALGLDPSEPDIMRRKPFSHGKSIFSEGLWQKIIFEGFMIGFLALLAFGIGKTLFDHPGSHIIGRTMAFATLSISELVHAFNMRSEKSIFGINLLGNLYLIGALITGVALQASVIMIAPLAKIFRVAELGTGAWLVVTALSLAPLAIVELEKLAAEKISQKPENTLPSRSHNPL